MSGDKEAKRGRTEQGRFSVNEACEKAEECL